MGNSLGTDYVRLIREMDKWKTEDAKERRGSAGTIEEMFKRKREELEGTEMKKKKESEGDEGAVKKNNKTAGTPGEENSEGAGGLRELLKEWTNEHMESIITEMRGMKKEIIERFREGGRGQEEIRMELREMKREMGEKEKR